MELLVVIAIVAVLASILLPALGRAKERGKRAACINNLRQLAAATLMYAEDDKDQSLSARADKRDENLNWLNDGYVNSTRVFLCPSTRNFILTNQSKSQFTGETGLTGLMYPAENGGRHPGMSYRGLGFAGREVPTYSEFRVSGEIKRIVGIRKTLANVQTYQKYHNAFNLKGIVPGPSRMLILVDNVFGGKSFFLDSKDNHGADGGHAAFCDGHVDWVPASKALFTYELSQDENRTSVE